MKIQITQAEIEAFVREGLSKQIQVANSASLKIEFTATRGADGITATIDVPYVGLTGLPVHAPTVVSPINTTLGTPIGAPTGAAPTLIAQNAEDPTTAGDDVPFPTTEEPAADTTAGKSLFPSFFSR